MQNECLICRRQPQKAYVVFEDDNWIVRHSNETNILGYFLIESRRHFLDLSEANAVETSSYGPVLKSVMAAIRQATQCERVYTFSLAEAVPHYHLHVIPRRAEFPRAYRGRGIMQYPLAPAADDALIASLCDRVQRLIRQSIVAATSQRQRY